MTELRHERGDETSPTTEKKKGDIEEGIFDLTIPESSKLLSPMPSPTTEKREDPDRLRRYIWKESMRIQREFTVKKQPRKQMCVICTKDLSKEDTAIFCYSDLMFCSKECKERFSTLEDIQEYENYLEFGK